MFEILFNLVFFFVDIFLNRQVLIFCHLETGVVDLILDEVFDDGFEQ